jgi:hypothetical protein
MVKVSLQCIGWPLAGVRRTPMLVGTISEYANLSRSLMPTGVSFQFNQLIDSSGKSAPKRR